MSHGYKQATSVTQVTHTDITAEFTVDMWLYYVQKQFKPTEQWNKCEAVKHAKVHSSIVIFNVQYSVTYPSLFLNSLTTCPDYMSHTSLIFQILHEWSKLVYIALI